MRRSSSSNLFFLSCVLVICIIIGSTLFTSKNDTMSYHKTDREQRATNAFMCTGIRLKAKNSAVLYGRTMEFDKDIESTILVVPRNYSFVGTTPLENVEGLRWKSKYAVVGANASGVTHFVDGVNEVGLAGGLFYFSGCAEYQDVDASTINNSIAPSELMTWILTTCATVHEVKQALATLRVSKTVFKPWGFIPPIHAIVHDDIGNSLVIEYVNGSLHLYDNPLGVITNSPTFDWHLTNLKNYTALFACAQRKMQGRANVPAIQMHELGSLGLPGDFSSTSRFVRAAFFSQIIVPSDNEDETRDLLFHLLNLFDIPIGMVGERLGTYDYTQWTSVCDLRNKKYYFHTYENRQIHCVDLMKCNVNAQKPLFIAMKRQQKVIDCTPSFALP